MLNYDTNGASNVFYYERLSYLLTHFDTHNCIVNCACNISTFVAKVLAEAPSVTEKDSVQCHYDIKNIPIAEINTKPILTHDMRNGLQKCVDMFFNKENVLCKNCNSKVVSEVNPETHLLIDVENGTVPIAHINYRTREHFPIGHGPYCTRTRSDTVPIGHGTNRTRIQLDTVTIGHTSFQSDTDLIAHGPNCARTQLRTDSIARGPNCTRPDCTRPDCTWTRLHTDSILHEEKLY